MILLIVRMNISKPLQLLTDSINRYTPLRKVTRLEDEQNILERETNYITSEVNRGYFKYIYEIYVIWYVLDWSTGRRQRTPEAVFSFKEGNLRG